MSDMEREETRHLDRDLLYLNTALAELAGEILSAAKLKDISSKALELACRLSRSPLGLAGVADATQRRLVSVTVTPEMFNQCKVAEPGSILDKSWGLWRRVLGQGQGYFSNDLARESLGAGAPAGHIPISRLLAAPAMVRGELAGVIALANARRDYTELDLERLRRLASLYALAIQQKRWERELRRSEERHRQLVENAGEAIMVFQDERLCLANSAAGSLLGLGPRELAGKPLQDLVHPEDLDSVLARHRGRLAGSETSSDSLVRMIHGTGKTVWVQMNSVRVFWEDAPAVLSFGRDVTRQRRLEEQARQRQQLNTLGALASGVAHDLNNSLGVVLGNLEMMADDLGPQHGSLRSLNRAMQAARRSRDMVRQILAFKRLSPAEPQPLSMKDMVEEALNLVSASLPEQVHLRIDLEDGGLVLADATQMHQVIINLCLNAAQAMEPKGGDLTVALRGVEIGGEEAARLDLQAGAYIKLTVSDQGCGMTGQVLARAFEPFYTTKAPGKGTGLGLSIVSGIVGEYGGAVEVQSQPERGSVFSVLLPRFEGEAAPHEAEPGQAPAGQGERLALVDDLQDYLVTQKRLLERQGYRVTAFQDPLEALAAIAAAPQDWDLIITDYNMPGLNGLELIQKLPPATRPPAIICTGYGDVLTPQGAKAAGAVDLLIKPVERKRLARAVRRALELKT